MTKRTPLIIGSGIAIAVILLASRSRMTEEEAEIRETLSSIPADMPVTNLGEVEFVSGVPKAITLDSGKTLTITATSQEDDLIKMVFEYKSTNRKAAGLVTETYAEKSRFMLRPGMRCAPKTGDELAVVVRPTVIELVGDILP